MQDYQSQNDKSNSKNNNNNNNNNNKSSYVAKITNKAPADYKKRNANGETKLHVAVKSNS